jgi:glycosyltransferase involved in cell wall biosynthesis
MIYLAYFVLAFTALQLFASLINLIFRESLAKNQLKSSPLVSVLIPARNEEENVRNILQDLLLQNYKNIEIIVFNDQSEDKTADIVKEFENKDPRVKLINSPGLPAGWLGKNFACHNLSGAAKGKYLLFIDADVRISGGIISGAAGFAAAHDLALVSIFPRQLMFTFGEMITVPNMNFILLSLLPLIFVRKSAFPSLAAANGQFMLFNSGVYKTLFPHELTKNNKVEDIEIARLLKREGFRIACLPGNNNVMCRMYSGFKDAVNGFAKNVTSFFGNSLLLSFLFWITTTFGIFFILMTMPTAIVISFLLMYAAIRVMVSIVSEQNMFLNLLYIIPQQISCGFFIYNAFINKYFKDYKWKGRSIK